MKKHNFNTINLPGLIMDHQGRLWCYAQAGRNAKIGHQLKFYFFQQGKFNDSYGIMTNTDPISNQYKTTVFSTIRSERRL